MALRLPNSHRTRLYVLLTCVAGLSQGLAALSLLGLEWPDLASVTPTAAARQASAAEVRPLDRPAESLAPARGAAGIRPSEGAETEPRLLARLEAPPGLPGTALDGPIAAGPDADARQPDGRSLHTPAPEAVPIAAPARQTVLWAAFAAFLLQSSLLWAAFNRRAGPISDLHGAIREIGEGRLEIPVPLLDRRGDIGGMARALEAIRRDLLHRHIGPSGAERRILAERRGVLCALEAAGGALMILDETRAPVFANDRMSRYCGSSLDLAPLLERILDGSVRFGIEDAVARGDTFSATAEIRRTDTGAVEPEEEEDEFLPDDTLPVRLRVNPILAENGTPIGSVILVTDATEEIRVASRIRRLTEHDTLTGLHNRQVLEARIDAALATGARDLTLLLLDIDRFKIINDALGHNVGDALLVHMAETLRLLSRRIGLTVRLGGDEFAVLIHGDDAAGVAETLADRIVKTFEKPQQVGERQLVTGTSIGIASVDRTRASARDVLRMADLALYEAKRRGRGRYIEFESALAEAVARKSEIENALRQALRAGEISAHYQQQRALPDRRLTGFEALARWTSPGLGPVSPGEFIPIAEESGLIGTLTHQMIEAAARTAARWHKLGFDGRVSVNVSPMVFAEDVVELIQDALLVTGCPPVALQIEITEAVFVDQEDRALRQIERLRAMGVSVALDDFGMGYSSLGYLQRFPVDTIKIDRAFVSRMQGSDVTRAIVKAIVEMGHALGMTVTGEGAENEADVALLTAAGVDTVQGFVDGRPMARDEADAMVRQHRTALLEAHPARREQAG